MRKLQTLVSIILSLAFLAGCTSKFGDKDPDSTNTNGFTVEGSMKANEDLDKKLARLEDNVEIIRNLLNAFRRVKKAEVGQDSYTHIDFILDVNDQLSKAPSRQDGTKYVREGSITLKIKGLSQECQTIETRLETLSKGGSVDTELDGNGIPVDGVIYSVKTCHSQDQFLPVATVTFTTESASLDFNNDNIRKTLMDILTPVVQINTNCQLTVDAQNVLAHGECTNVSSNLSATEKLLFETISYDRYADIRLDIEGKILGNDQPKAAFAFAIDKDLKVKKWKLDKVP